MKLLEWLDGIDAQTKVATAPPWTVKHRHAARTTNADEADGLGLEVEGPPEPMLRGQFARAADANFIAASRTNVPQLVALLREAREVLDLAAAGGDCPYQAARDFLARDVPPVMPLQTQREYDNQGGGHHAVSDKIVGGEKRDRADDVTNYAGADDEIVASVEW